MDYEDKFPSNRWYLTAREVNDLVFSWLERCRRRKFFLWIHYSDPHDPYAPPDLPPDTQLFFNNDLIDEYCLIKYSTHEVSLRLKKGINKIRFELKKDLPGYPEYFRARFDKFDIAPQNEGKVLDVEFSKEWSIQREGGIIYLRRGGTIDIFNPNRALQVDLSFRGRLLFLRKAMRKFYKQEVEYLDGEIGRFWKKLKKLNLFRKTHILIAGDHGGGLGEYATDNGGLHYGHIHFLKNV